MRREHRVTNDVNMGNIQCTFSTRSPATTTVPGDHRRVTKAAASPERANPTNQGTSADRRVADLLSVFAFVFEVPLNAVSSAAYGFLPRLPRPGSPGPEVRPSPSCDDTGSQWRSGAGGGGGVGFSESNEKETRGLTITEDGVVSRTNYKLVASACYIG